MKNKFLKNHKTNCQCGCCKAVRGETKGNKNPHYGHCTFLITKEFLLKEYKYNKKSTHQIAKEVGCTSMTIHHKMVKYGIPRRNLSESNFFKGKKRPEHSNKMKGRKNPAASIRIKDKVGKDALAYIDGRTSKIYYCIEECGNKISYQNWKYGNRRCQSCANRLNMKGKMPWCKNKKCPQLSGKNNGMYGKGRKPNWGQYKNIKMRSSWEIAYAKYLDERDIKWQYESKTFELVVNNKATTYTPDFYLPEQNLYIEVKGYFNDNFKDKFESFKKQYPELKIELLMKEELKQLKVLV